MSKGQAHLKYLLLITFRRHNPKLMGVITNLRFCYDFFSFSHQPVPSKKSDIGSPFSAGSCSIQAEQSSFLPFAVDQHLLQAEPLKALLKDVTSKTQV